MSKAGQGVLYALRGEMFAHLQRLSLKFYDKTEVGRLMSRVLGDVYQLQEFMSVAVITLGDLLSLSLIVVAVLAMSVKLGLISMFFVPILAVTMMVWQPFARRAFIEVRRAISIVNGALNENITGVRVVQSMNRQERNLKLFDEKNHESLTTSLSATRLSTGLLFPVDTMTHMAIGLVIFFGARMVSDNAIEVGTMVAFVLYIQRFFDPIRSLTMQYTQLQRAMASGFRIFELLDTELDTVQIVAAAPEALLVDGRLPSRPLIVASEYSRITQNWMRDKNIEGRFVRSWGATEVLPPEDADCIVDNTATGSTLRANRLEIIDTLMTSSTRLFASPRVLEDPEKCQRIEALVLVLRSVLDARKRVMIEFNLDADRLDSVLPLVPSMRQPTIATLRDQLGVAVKAAVPKAGLAGLIPTLKSAGATDVVVSRIDQIIA